jgi:hypothetical protein
MAKTVKPKPLTQVEKDYIKLYLADLMRTKGKVTPPDFDLLAEKMNKPVDIVKTFASGQAEIVVTEPETEKPKPKSKLNHIQKTIREQMKGETAGRRDNVTFMSEGTSTLIQEAAKHNPNQSASPKYESNIYRGNG